MIEASLAHTDRLRGAGQFDSSHFAVEYAFRKKTPNAAPIPALSNMALWCRRHYECARTRIAIVIELFECARACNDRKLCECLCAGATQIARFRFHVPPMHGCTAHLDLGGTAVLTSDSPRRADTAIRSARTGAPPRRCHCRAPPAACGTDCSCRDSDR